MARLGLLHGGSGRRGSAAVIGDAADAVAAAKDKVEVETTAGNGSGIVFQQAEMSSSISSTTAAAAAIFDELHVSTFDVVVSVSF